MSGLTLVALCACGPIGRDALWGRPGADVDAAAADAASCELEPPETPTPPVPASASGERAPHQYFALRVQDQDGAPVVGAALRTVHRVRLQSDAHGNVAFYEPGLMGLDVYFSVEREGYALEPDGFGNRGKAFRVDEGGSGVITLQRLGSAASASDASDLQSRLLAGPVRMGAACFAIHVVDQATKRGVPLVFVKSADEQLITDSQGFAADCHPDHAGQRVRYALASHGYAFAAGEVELEAQPGASALLELTRLNLAERLYRSTGQGIYRESQLLGLTAPGAERALRGRVLQQDAVSVAEHQGKLFWLWGNTDRPAYPLGNFWGSSATSAPGQASDASLGLQLEYLLGDEGVARAMGQQLAPTNLPSWLSSLISLPDATGTAQLFAVYAKPRSDLSLAARGLARLDADQVFRATSVSYPAQDFVGPRGQPLRVRHADGEYVYFAPPLRVRASAESLLDPGSYELFTAHAADSSELTRTGADALRYDFRTRARPTRAQDVADAGLAPAQSLEGHWADALGGTPIRAADDGAAAFSQHQQRFVRVFQQLGGISSFAGEIWYAEADTPLGPWVYAQKILTHDRYTFYSPWLHPYFQQGSGRFLYFEGSYTSALAGEGVEPTPRYERNQIMYRLDLDDPRLALPVPIYDLSGAGQPRLGTRRDVPASSPPLAPLFFAPERAVPHALAVSWSGPDCAPRRLLLGDSPRTPALFYAFAPDDEQRPAQLVPLFELHDQRGARAYALSAAPAGLSGDAAPLAYVWPSPIAVPLPVAEFVPPLVASAGPDQCLREQGAGRGALVALTAEGSHSDQDPIAAYRWYLDGAACPFAEAEAASLRVASGVHTITLRIRDAAGRTAEDHLLLEVAPSASAAPR